MELLRNETDSKRNADVKASEKVEVHPGTNDQEAVRYVRLNSVEKCCLKIQFWAARCPGPPKPCPVAITPLDS